MSKIVKKWDDLILDAATASGVSRVEMWKDKTRVEVRSDTIIEFITLLESDSIYRQQLSRQHYI